MDNEGRMQNENSLRTLGGDDAVLSSLVMVWRPKNGRGVEITFEVDNLWDSNFQDVPAVPAPGRQMAVSLAYGW